MIHTQNLTHREYKTLLANLQPLKGNPGRIGFEVEYVVEKGQTYGYDNLDVFRVNDVVLRLTLNPHGIAKKVERPAMLRVYGSNCAMGSFLVKNLPELQKQEIEEEIRL